MTDADFNADLSAARRRLDATLPLVTPLPGAEDPQVGENMAIYHFQRFLDVVYPGWQKDEHLADTPARVVRMFRDELFAGHAGVWDFTTFPAEGDTLIVMRDIPFVSLCAHHFLPFTGVAHIGYLPGNRIAGLSKLARAVEMFARQPQVQERLTNDIADFLADRLQPRAVGVVLAARHECMEIRGVKKAGAVTVTSALRGAFLSDDAARHEFLSLAHGGHR
jgi:GTP cyclohydrolase I